jgi:hypothetical protein
MRCAKALSPVEILQSGYCGKVQLAAGYKIGLGAHGSESWPAFLLKSPGPEPAEFEPFSPKPFKPEPSNPKADGPNAFKPVPSNPKPRNPKAPRFSKPNKSGTNDKSPPPKEFCPWKEFPPQSICCWSRNRGDPRREAFDLFREWECEEWPNEELPNREFSKFEVSRLRSKEKDVDLNPFDEDN